MAREYTMHLYDLLDQEYVSKEFVIDMCLRWLSEDDVRTMLEHNDLTEFINMEKAND